MEKDGNHLECSISDTDIFTPAFVQSDIERCYYEECFPITKLDDNGSVEFVVENASDKFIDLVNTYLKVKLKIVKGDGSDLEATDKVTLTNYPIGSIFSQVDVNLGGTIVSNSTNTYPYRAYLETLLNFSDDARKSQLTMGLFTKDTANNMNETDPEKENVGLKERNSYSRNVVELCGRLHSDLFSQGRLVINGVQLKIILNRQKENFMLMSENSGFKVKLLNVTMVVRKVQLTQHKFTEIQKSLETTSAVYPINRIGVKSHSVASGLTSLNWDNAFVGQLPNKLFIMMTDNDAFTGVFKKNPYNFKHFNLSSIGVYVNGESTPSHPMKLNWTNGDYLEAYRSLFLATGKINRDEGICISRKEFADGYVIFGYDLTASNCNGTHQEPRKQGSVRINLEFAEALPTTVSIIVYADFDNRIEIDKTRHVIKDF